MLHYLQELESEAIHIIREAAAEFENPVIFYSIGKDSSVLVRLVQKAFYPGGMPFPLLHVDTGYKFPEMLQFRDAFVKRIGARLIVERNEDAIAGGAHPSKIGMDRCCAQLKTAGLLNAIAKHDFDAALGGARREEEKSRATERVFSLRDRYGQWNPRNQRPEVWDLYNGRINEGETVRVFPLSNWTELDVWHYIKAENIPVVPLYFARERQVVSRKGILIPVDALDLADSSGGIKNEEVQSQMCRFRSLGCIPCTGAVRSDAVTLDQIINEVASARKSERANRIIDLTSDSSMEQKKKEGYF
ncbi:MAG: sulfate adenylyltransferase subunit CysD [Acidobacteriota bacterium]|jgi:sulfate adenylyltransferase subunit 2